MTELETHCLSSYVDDELEVLTLVLTSALVKMRTRIITSPQRGNPVVKGIDSNQTA